MKCPLCKITMVPVHPPRFEDAIKKPIEMKCNCCGRIIWDCSTTYNDGKKVIDNENDNGVLARRCVERS